MPLTYINHKNIHFRKPLNRGHYYLITFTNHLEMSLEATEKDISIAFEKLAFTSNDHCKTGTTIFSHFKSKILAAIDEIR